MSIFLDHRIFLKPLHQLHFYFFSFYVNFPSLFVFSLISYTNPIFPSFPCVNLHILHSPPCSVSTQSVLPCRPFSSLLFLFSSCSQCLSFIFPSVFTFPRPLRLLEFSLKYPICPPLATFLCLVILSHHLPSPPVLAFPLYLFYFLSSSLATLFVHVFLY